MPLASSEFHRRGDLPWAPSFVMTVLSRSTWDWTQVSLFLLPVIAQHGGAALSQDLQAGRSLSAAALLAQLIGFPTAEGM